MLGAAELKVVREARQGDVHGRDVEDDHQLGDEQDAQENAACLAGVGAVVAGPRRAGCGSSRVSPSRSSFRDAWPSMCFKTDSGVWLVCAHFRLLLERFGDELTLALPTAVPEMRLARDFGVADHTVAGTGPG